MNGRGQYWRDASLIWPSLAGLLAAILSAGAILLFTPNVLLTNRSQQQALQTQLNATRAATAMAQTTARDTRANRQRYLMLQQRGAIGGGEHRLAWVEQLGAIKQASPALQLHYRIEPQRPLEHSTPIGGSVLVSSRMNIGYTALHEEDFSRLHRSLKTAPGWLAASRCIIDRQQESGARLAVTCDYEWLSIATFAATKEGVTR